uniref:SH3 domain-containing protein n=1 Tax=Tetraodon nigroviridis TaxID=99883 RepID=H3D101_TETNG
MAEARSEEEEENMRDVREQVVRRQSNNSGGRSDRRKPEHRHSFIQGPLSSIRAAIKRMFLSASTRPTSLSEASRPEITILSAEPLASTSWFPGASGGLPPPPPPAAQIWDPPFLRPFSISSLQPPPSYEEVIREKTQEQVLLPSSSSPARPSSTITIATQTDPGSDPSDSQGEQCRFLTQFYLCAVKRPLRPARPPHPFPIKPSLTDDNTSTTNKLEDGPAAPDVPLERPRPRPRSKVDLQPINREVKVQTLVKLREDGLATIAARTAAVGAKQDPSQGKYLTELLEAFSSDDWGSPDRHSDSSEHSQSDNEEGEAEEDMATLKARIQAFEQQPVVDGRPEPRPRPRLQGLPAKSVPPAVAPKPKNILNAPKPSTLVTPKPATESHPSSHSAPVPAPRPSPPKHATPVGEASSLTPILPPRPVVAPRASLGSTNPGKSTAAGHMNPIPPPRPSNATLAETGEEETQTPAPQNGFAGLLLCKQPILTVQHGLSTETKQPFISFLCFSENWYRAPKQISSSVSNTQSQCPVARQKPLSSPLRKTSESQTKPNPTNGSNSSEPPLPPRPASMKLLPLRPPPFKSNPGRPPPPSISSSLANLTTAPPHKTIPAPSVSSPNQTPSGHTNSSVSTNLMPPRASKKGPPLPPRPKPGHPLYNSHSERRHHPYRLITNSNSPVLFVCQKQDVLIVLDNPSPLEDLTGDGSSGTTITPLIDQSQCLLDLDIQPKPVTDEDKQTKAALEGLNLSDSQSILPELPAEQKEKPAPPPLSGPRCLALFDYEGEENDELTFSQGDVIALQELVGHEWGRGQIHGRVGIFPLNFTKVVEPLPQSVQSAGEAPDPESTSLCGQTVVQTSCKGVHVCVWKWNPVKMTFAVFKTLFRHARPFFLQVGDIITEMESVDEEWIVGVVDGKRGIVPKNYV